ncbi:putative lysosomal cobalamin transporter [Hypsibius exemplaris]|uniref:Lysosomal cobalamin transporter n=1 Tax=Hypsibius exemplaris TaxID=2072580 RepID=A0A1W0WNU0_HYPEX|nr:putative lysosomal cobalamin transporter [Hypsibius exemplaris]
MILPSSVAAYGWIPFAAVILLILLFSVLFIRHYQSAAEYEFASSAIAVLSLLLTLSTFALLPVDVFLVSWMKTANGTFQDWAANKTDRDSVEAGVMYAYYSLYSVLTVLAFLVLPFAYFYYEERDDDRPWRPRFCSALKYSIGFTILAGAILLTGAFIPLNNDLNLNGTAWDDLQAVFHSFEKNGGEDAISFLVSILCLIGIIFNVVYTGYGMANWPIRLIKGSRSVRRDYEDVVARRAEMRREQEAANSRLYPSIRSRELQERERLLARQERELEGPANSRVRAFLAAAWRPFEVLGGVALLSLSLLIFVSLLLTNVDKAMHSYMHYGYLLPKSNRTLPNPIDWVLVKSQVVFPLDFILFGIMAVFMVLATIMAVRNLGIRCLCIKLFRIRPHGTRPQGILFLCFILIFSVLGLNVIFYFLSPQYSTFGSQHYLGFTDLSDGLTGAMEVKPCEELVVDDCEMTRNSFFLVRYFFKAWFFGACYYWFSWGILAMYIMGLLHTLVQKQATAADEAVDDYDELE